MVELRRRGLLAAGVAAGLAGCSPVDLLNATVSDADVSETRDISYAAGERHRLDVYRPRSVGGGLPLMVFIYGGGWNAGDKGMYGFVARPLARQGTIVVVPDYRLSPQVAYPAFLQDNAAAVAWAFAHARELGADPERIVLMGHSAGAFNVAMLGLDPRWLAAAGVDRERLAGVVGLAGPYRFLPSADPDVIPVFGAANTPANEPYAFADGRGPPMFLGAGTEDTIVQPRNTTELAARQRERGGRVTSKLYPGVGHVGLITAFAPVFQGRAPVLEDVAGFVAGARA
ncbi:MAG: alpha/beta hydrolase [Janthinobacterium lividum]